MFAVAPTVEEPVPGWIDNIYGPIAIVAGVGCGVLRVAHAEPRNILDIVPADTVTNCIIAAAISSRKRWVTISAMIRD
ncbi:hypothetical protein PR048_022733 [Dryococelus australis]|uniref:Fatty acyl-CoA reductase n=1 Tax=Dryococelus australis TaxID=614101 RepID=A0ABQ9GS82_9NEOP|nr:hypothetical protein PR048_022733 [Dryococelus australis]